MMAIVMGVSGCGKTTVGRLLARELGCEFLDADDFHSEANVAKMANGVALTDDDRWPWLDAIVAAMQERAARGAGAVIACSALKEGYRDRLCRGMGAVDEVRIVYLKGDTATIAPRLASRSDHYMPASLLDSQFAALEEPGDAIVVDIRQPTEEQVRQIAAALQSTSDSAA
jgi:gluconokinase